MQSVWAVYENGVLRPTEPLALSEGQKVAVIVTPAPPPAPPLTPEEWERRMRSAKDIHEWVELANNCPNPEPDFDVVKAINETRRLTGFRVPDPEPGGETAR